MKRGLFQVIAMTMALGAPLFPEGGGDLVLGRATPRPLDLRAVLPGDAWVRASPRRRRRRLPGGFCSGCGGRLGVREGADRCLCDGAEA